MVNLLGLFMTSTPQTNKASESLIEQPDELHQLLNRIQNPKTREVSNSFFTVEGVDLASAFMPEKMR
jgi:hypothetical protein